MKTLFPIIFIVIAIGAFIAFGSPLNNDVKNLNLDIKQYNQALNNSTDLEKTRDDLLDVYNKITNEDKARLDAFLPNNANNIELILEIQQIARKYDMPLSEIKIDPIGVNGNSNGQTTTNTQNTVPTNPSLVLPYGVFNLEFAVEGSYDTFLLFLKDLEDNLRLINVKSITFSSTANDKSGLTTDSYKYNLKVETYWFKN